MAVTTAPAALLRYIPLSHNSADSQASALRLLFALFPDWETSEGKVELVRFTDGITNTVCPVPPSPLTRQRPGSCSRP
jgi:ethanolamine kinase